MKTRNKKMKILKKILSISLVFVSLFAIRAEAANTYFYQSRIDGVVKELGFPSQQACESDYATVSVSRKDTPLKGCYAGTSVKIKSFSPTSVSIGDQITITGSNLIGVTSIRIGTTEATVYSDSDTSLRALILAGTTGGKITVTTQYRGTATSLKSVSITNASDSRWWYVNPQKQIQSPNGGFTTLAACTTDHATYNTNNPGIINPTNACASGTLADWQQAKKDEGPLIPKIPTPQDPAVLISGKDGSTPNGDNNIYTPLAPIGGIKTIQTSGGVCPGNKSLSNGIGCYLNTIFILAIGLCGALAVVMIIISSIQYMGDESVFGKTEAKGKIVSAIMGLFIALGAYALLNTINPDLTGRGGVKLDQASALITDPGYQRGVSHSGASGRRAKLSTFKNKSYHDFALAAVMKSNLLSASPTDIKNWIPDGKNTAENWVSLLAGMAQAESSFNTNELYIENFPDSSTKTLAVSVGLYQLSVGDCAAKVYGLTSCTQAQLEDPEFNTNLAVNILNHWIVTKKDNVIGARIPDPTNSSKIIWGGGARYWSTLR